MRFTATTFPVTRCWAVLTVPKLPAERNNKREKKHRKCYKKRGADSKTDSQKKKRSSD